MNRSLLPQASSQREASGANATSSYILCHIIIHTMSHHHTYYVTSSGLITARGKRCERHIIIHTMSHHHTYSVTSSYILCHIIRPHHSARQAVATPSHVLAPLFARRDILERHRTSRRRGRVVFFFLSFFLYWKDIGHRNGGGG